MTPSRNNPNPQLVEQYRQELLKLMPTAPAPAEENWLDQRYPAPDIPRDRAALTAAPAAEEAPVPPEPPAAVPSEPSRQSPTEPPAIAPTPFIGYLRVFAVTASGAEPIEGAQVTVSGNGTVVARSVTDRDGYTQVIPLPTVDPALSLTPGNPAPYVPYTVLTVADGFRPVRHSNLPVYGNDFVTQTVMLTPLTPGDDPDAVQEFLSGAPENL